MRGFLHLDLSGTPLPGAAVEVRISRAGRMTVTGGDGVSSVTIDLPPDVRVVDERDVNAGAHAADPGDAAGSVAR